MPDEIRLERKRGYTVLQNEMVLDTRLSLKTKGLMAVIISRPPDWSYSITGLAAMCGVGKDAIRSALRELEEAGYLTRRQVHTEDGQFGGYEYLIRESASLPDEAPQEECDSPSSGFPTTGKPTTGKPTTGNPTLINKDKINKDRNQYRNNYPPIVPPEGERRSRTKKIIWTADWMPDRFEAFWAFYRDNVCKEGRQRAIRAWDKLKPDEATIAAMGRDLIARLKSEQWRAGIGIPYAATYINQRRWEDGEGREAGTPDRDGAVSSGGWAPDPEVL